MRSAGARARLVARYEAGIAGRNIHEDCTN
jgi:hypothetical protein